MERPAPLVQTVVMVKMDQEEEELKQEVAEEEVRAGLEAAEAEARLGFPLQPLPSER